MCVEQCPIPTHYQEGPEAYTESMYGYNKSCEVYMVRCDKAAEEGGGRDAGGIGAKEGVAMWGLLSRPHEELGQMRLYKQTNRLGEREH